MGHGLLIIEVSRSHTTTHHTPLDKWSARRRDLYLTTSNTHKRQTSLSPVGFEPTISAGERLQTYAFDHAAIGTGTYTNIIFFYKCRDWIILHGIVNTLRRGDADLRFYVTTVQDGWRRFAFLTRWNSVHLQVLLSATPQEGMFREVSHTQALLGSLLSISWKFQFTKVVSEFVINF